MAGGHQKFRHLSRSSAHRQAMLRNMVTSLITHESIRTTWHKAKEAQKLAEKLITLGKKNTNASRRRASQILFVCPPSQLPNPPQCQEMQIRETNPYSSPGPSLPLPQTLRHPPHPLPHPPRRLHSRPTHRIPQPQQRPSPLRHPRTRRRATGHAIRPDGQNPSPRALIRNRRARHHGKECREGGAV